MSFWCLQFSQKNKQKQFDLRYHNSTGKSLSEALIFASINPQYDSSASEKDLPLKSNYFFWENSRHPKDSSKLTDL